MTYEKAKQLSSDNSQILRGIFDNVTDDTYERIIEIIRNNNFLINFLDDLYFLQPLVPPVEKDGWKNKSICNQKLNNSRRNERLVSLNSYDSQLNQFIQLHPRIFVHPQYFIDGRKGSFPEIYVREGVLEAILEHLEFLPDDYGIMVYDGFRTFDCQKDIYDEIFAKKLEEELANNKDNSKSVKEIEEYVRTTIMPNYVSFPSFNPPSTHNTGGALDCRICDMDGNVLNYGCEFDEFENVANLYYFESKLNKGEYLTDSELEALLIRRVTTNILKYPTYNSTYPYVGAKTNNSFVDFAGEDWHVDINNQWDVEISTAMYGSCEADGIIPDPNYTIENYLKERQTIIKIKNN